MPFRAPASRGFLRNHSFIFQLLCLLAALPAASPAATPDRIGGVIDSSRTRSVGGNIHRLAQAKYDRGEADPLTPMNYMVMLLQPSSAQQADLAQLVAAQQNPASSQYHKWLTPEAFGERFGLSQADLVKISSWLKAEGFSIDRQARGGNWIAFSGSAAQTSRAFHTSIHRYSVNGEWHFANTGDPQVPEALAGIAGGFLGLNDFPLEPQSHLVSPAFTTAGQHFLAPSDFATIYNLTPLQQANIDGTGQSIAIVGESDVFTSDLSQFRTRYGLAANTPRMVLYGGADPGVTGALVEGELDLEWAGAIAPKASLTYVYGASAFSAMLYAIEANLAPIVSVSYGTCEVGVAAPAYEAIAQQANAQGITIVAASGDSGAAACDGQGFMPQATLGRSVLFPATLPEVTGIGGTQFAEGTGTYWAATNSSNFGSAMSYIPEAVWNESNGSGLGASGGGASRLYSKPAWQNGQGVPADGARDVPDLAFSAAGHDAYELVFEGGNAAIAGTSCGTPTFAAIVALLNQYQIKNAHQSSPGLGNINPQLYRLAQTAPSAFHDVTSGNNMVACAQGTADCATGSFGYPAGPAYDQATGLGSLDVNMLFTQWNSAVKAVTVTLSASPATGTANDTVQLTATVTATSPANAAPTGSVNFSSSSGVPFGSAPLSSNGGKLTATISLPLWSFDGVGTFAVVAQYSGDAVFSGAGALLKVKVTNPTGAAAVVVSGPNTVWPGVDLDAQGQSWSATLSLHELAGVAAAVTGFTMDGQALSVPQYFPSPDIVPSGTLSATIVLRNVQAPLTHTFVLSGVDVFGQTWSRQIAVNYNQTPPQNQYAFTVTPLTVTQTSDPSCQFPVQLNLNDEGGFLNSYLTLYAGTVSMPNQFVPVFGTTRLQAWASLQGTLCLNGITPPAREYIYAVRSDNLVQQTVVDFAPPPASPITISASPASIAMSSTSVSQPAQATLSLAISDKTQQWTATVYPANRTSGWLSVSQLAGTGPAQLTLTASGFGFEPGAYRAWIVFQSQNAQPQTITVPIMFVLGANPNMTISGIAGTAPGQTAFAPGMLLSVYGTNLAGTTLPTTAVSGVFPFTAGSVTVTVNGFAAPVLYVSPTQINLQIPFEAGAGPAVLGINNNGQAAGFQFQLAPSAPAIYDDGSGNIAGNPSIVAGGIATLYINGAGEVNPLLLTGNLTPNAPTISPVLPLTVTVGGVPALLQFAGLSPGTLGTTQVNFYVPANAKSGPQPVVITINGAASPALNMTVK
jgi:uncharacterized protein (TIGR03437 family)